MSKMRSETKIRMGWVGWHFVVTFKHDLGRHIYDHAGRTPGDGLAVDPRERDRSRRTADSSQGAPLGSGQRLGVRRGPGDPSLILVCAGCGERERDPAQPWYRLTMMLSSREIRTWNYCRRACITGDRITDRREGSG